MNSLLTRARFFPVLTALGFLLTNCPLVVAQNEPLPEGVDGQPDAVAQPPAPAPPDRPVPVSEPTSENDPAATGQTSDPASEGEYDVLMQGPVHEAFAAPIDTDLSDGVRVYSKAPPEPVDEQPPETQPEDQGMKWIPGYWAWDDDLDDYVWVSGLWRKIPPGRDWVPGYWSQAGSGYRWTSGYWTDAQLAAEAPSYLPLPPESIDNGPSVPPPGEDYFWVPGHWEYAGNDYRWYSGFWSQQYDDWIWQPTCYLYTPQGYLMVDGYWDYLPSSRAILYSPVRFYDFVYTQPNYVYRPRYPLATTASLLVHLFFRSGYPHYYYGDYYGPGHRSLGFHPWYDIGFGAGYGHSSPWLGYYDWKYRKSGINFVGSMKRYENHVRAHSGPSSPQHFAGKASQSGGSKPGRAVGGRSGVGRSGEPKHKQFTGSLDQAVRSDVGRVAITRDANRSNSYLSPGAVNRSRNVAPPGLSRSVGGASAAGIARQPASDRFLSDRVRSDLGTLNRSAGRGPQSAMPSFRSPGVTGGPGQSSRSRSIRSLQTPSFNASPNSPGRPSMPTPSFNRGSAPSLSRGAAPSINRGSAPSLNRGAAPSLNRGSAPSLNRGSAPSFNRGSGPSMKTNRGRGASGSRGSAGKPKSGGSKGRGKGKK